MTHARTAGALVALVIALTVAACGNDGSNRELTVGAASSLRPLLDQVVVLFEAETGIGVMVSYGASGTIAQQIAQGAPLDVFASADIVQVNDLTIRHFLDKDSIFAWGYGQLVVVMPLDGDPAIETLMDAERIAIANPETAPYGAAAKQLMQQNNVWDQVEGSFVFAETALQALLFAQAGEVDFAFVPLSLVRADGDGVRIVEQSVRFNDFGQRLPEPISLTQALAVVADSASSERARRFVEFFATNDVIELMRSLGYTPVIELMRGSDAR